MKSTVDKWTTNQPARPSRLQASIIFHGDQVRVVLPEPWQHARMHLAVEVIHQERTEDRDVVLVTCGNPWNISIWPARTKGVFALMFSPMDQ